MDADGEHVPSAAAISVADDHLGCGPALQVAE